MKVKGRVCMNEKTRDLLEDTNVTAKGTLIVEELERSSKCQAERKK